MQEETNDPIWVATHNGAFQADEVFGVAALDILITRSNREMRLIRTRDPAQLSRCDFLVDVGMEYVPEKGRFDHHQPQGAGFRPTEDGEPYAAFGLVWKEFGEAICGSRRAAEVIDRRMVRHIDAVDCGFRAMPGYNIVTAIKSFNPCWNAGIQDFDQAFVEAFNFARRILEREITRSVASAKAYNTARKAILKSQKADTSGYEQAIVVLDEFVPWKGVVAGEFPNLRFVIYPDNNGDWACSAVPSLENHAISKTLFPRAWSDQKSDRLDAVTGIPGGVFCHRNGFLCIHKTKEGAKEMAIAALLAADSC